MEEVMKHLSEYDAEMLSDIIETLQDAWMLNEKWKEFYSRHWENYYKKKKSVTEQLEETRQTLSKTEKTYLIANRNKMTAEQKVQYFLENALLPTNK